MAASFLPPNQILPRLYIVRPGVTSTFTCTHPRHARCSCHQQPAASQQQAPAPAPAAAPATAPPPAKAFAAKAHADALRELQLRYQQIIANMMFALRDFPEAAAAIRDYVKANLPPESGPSPSYA
jgi:hypothetical protein